jgi:hypothetical protein
MNFKEKFKDEMLYEAVITFTFFYKVTYLYKPIK